MMQKRVISLAVPAVVLMAINGGMFKRDKIFKGPLVTIQVSDIDKAMKKIVEMGGRIVEKKMPVENMGYSAYFKDSEGNVMGLWQDLE